MISGQRLSFDEQINYFNKKVNVKTNSYLDVMGEEHDYFFMVAGAHRNEIVADFRTAVDKAIQNGTTIEEFRKDFDEIVKKHSWTYNGGRSWRTRIIYDTNIYGAYNKGRLAQHLDMVDEMPYWEYVHNDNDNPRPEHQSWDGKILRADDPWWRYYYPVKAYGCHCEVIAYDENDLRRMKRTVDKSPPIEWQEKLVGVRSGSPRQVRIPVGYDVGFAPHNFEHLISGDKRESIDKLLFQKMVSASPIIAAAAISNVLSHRGAKRLLDESLAPTVRKINQTKRASGEFNYVGVIPEEVIDKLTTLGLPPQSAVIAVRGEDILHALRDVKKDKGVNLPVEFWENLPKHLQKPDAILLERNQKLPTLLFVYETDKGKIAVKMDYAVKLKDKEAGKKVSYKLNIVRTGSVMRDFTALKDFELLWGKFE